MLEYFLKDWFQQTVNRHDSHIQPVYLIHDILQDVAFPKRKDCFTEIWEY